MINKLFYIFFRPFYILNKLFFSILNVYIYLPFEYSSIPVDGGAVTDAVLDLVIRPEIKEKKYNLIFII